MKQHNDVESDIDLWDSNPPPSNIADFDGSSGSMRPRFNDGKLDLTSIAITTTAKVFKFSQANTKIDKIYRDEVEKYLTPTKMKETILKGSHERLFDTNGQYGGDNHN